MKNKPYLPFFLVVSLLLFSSGIINVYAPAQENTNYNIFLSTDHALGFQHENTYVLINPTAGNINSTQTTLRLYDYSGSFRFVSNETCTLHLTFNVTNVKAGGDSGNEFRVLSDGAYLTVLADDHIFIQWDVSGADIWFPLTFILGMVGLMSMFGGSLLFVREMKKGNFDNDFLNSIIFVALGITLVIVWLWS